MERKDVWKSIKKAVFGFAVSGCGCCNECNGCGLITDMDQEGGSSQSMS